MYTIEAALTAKVAQLCQNVGFNAITQDSLNVLVDLYQKIFLRLGQHVKDSSTHNGRVESTFIDLVHTLDYLHMPIDHLLDYIKSVDLTVEFKIPKHEEKPSNRIDRCLSPDSLLEKMKTVKEEPKDDETMDEDHMKVKQPDPVLLKNCYQEIADKFPSNPVAAVSRIRRPSPVMIKIKNPIRPKTLAERKEIPQTSQADILAQTGGDKTTPVIVPDIVNDQDNQTKPEKKKKVKGVKKNRQSSIKITSKLKSKKKEERKQKLEVKKKEKIKIEKVKLEVEKLKDSAKKEKIKAPIIVDEIIEDIVPTSSNIKQDEIKEKQKPKEKPKQKSKVREKKSKFSMVTQTVEESAPTDEWLCPRCSNPDNGDLMIACDKCETWFHLKCTHLSVAPKDDENWECNECIQKNQQGKDDVKKKKEKETLAKVKFEEVEDVEESAPADEWLCPRCNNPDNGDLMIACDKCETWFHLKCTHLSVAPKDDENWECEECTDKRK